MAVAAVHLRRAMTDALASRAALSRTAVAAAQSEPHVTRAPRCRQWPGVTDEVAPPHAGLRMYGAAAFERCLQVAPTCFWTLAHPAREPSQLKQSSCAAAAASCHRHVAACAPGRGCPLCALQGPAPAPSCVCAAGQEFQQATEVLGFPAGARAPSLHGWSAHVCSAWMAAVTAALYAPSAATCYVFCTRMSS